MKVTAPRFIAGQRSHPYETNEEPLNARELAAIVKEIPVAVVQPRILVSSSSESSIDEQVATSSGSTSQPRVISPTLVNSVQQGSQFLAPDDSLWYDQEFSPTNGSIVLEEVEHFSPPPPRSGYEVHHTLTVPSESIHTLNAWQDILSTHLQPLDEQIKMLMDRQIRILNMLEQIMENRNILF